MIQELEQPTAVAAGGRVDETWRGDAAMEVRFRTPDSVTIIQGVFSLGSV